MGRGLFISLEGGEGAGKSTQAQHLAERIKQLKRDVVLTREPGGVTAAEVIRGLVTGGSTNWSAEAEALLNYAARDVHLRELIRPALSRGETVICDRFMDSTRAYQAYAGGCPHALIDALERAIVGPTRPHLTLIFDLDPEIGLTRAAARGNGVVDRFERKGLAFHQRLREAFLSIAVKEPQRCVVVDAATPEDALAVAIWRVVEPRLQHC